MFLLQITKIKRLTLYMTPSLDYGHKLIQNQLRLSIKITLSKMGITIFHSRRTGSSPNGSRPSGSRPTGNRPTGNKPKVSLSNAELSNLITTETVAYNCKNIKKRCFKKFVFA